jgi:putative lipase involved disintegration of autophagic bodies
LKLNIAAFHWWAVGDSNQIWRLPIHTAVLDAAKISTNPDLNMKISSAAEFGYERRLTARAVKETNKIILARNRASMIWIEAILIIAKIDDHGTMI